MATKKSSKSIKTWPYVVEGSHSRFTHYQDGSVHHEILWDRLAEDIDHALKSKETKSSTSAQNEINAVPDTETSTVPNKHTKSTNNKTSKATSSNPRKTKIKA